ncbi:hypothetical protein QBC34DRAFT_76284 [Podospora aff. communis PSN243]|uniref:Thioredoxin domain-containing protein n=1 Tax=Podospora aff. communis PSN243 TaxID=3040156 RepID=A0AAV9GVE1_9PEZI|nr:hypothetical protein QBC34DRAFT_76284 [Podospora aff. communis PSN243]
MSEKIVPRPDFEAALSALAAKEKAAQATLESLAAERRNLPMVKIDKPYTFHGPNNTTPSLDDLFRGKDQLIVYHFMFPPNAERGCSGCAFVGEHIPDTRHLESRNTAMAVISRAPFDKIAAWKEKLGWKFPWYSSDGSDFTYDFGGASKEGGDQANLTVFYRKDGEIYQTYSIFPRGVLNFLGTYQLLDFTPLGRQDGPDGPAGFKLNYEYEEGA